MATSITLLDSILPAFTVFQRDYMTYWTLAFCPVRFNYSSWKIVYVAVPHAHLEADEENQTAFFCIDIVHKNLPTKLRTSLSLRRLLKTQMERVKLNKSINWVSAKSQSSKTNRFKVLNEKDNRIREPDIQRERHFTVLDPVNHLVGYPRVQVQGGR